MKENDKPPSSRAPATGAESERDSSFVRNVGNWLKRGFGRNGETSWRESVEEFIEEEDEVAEQITPEERDLLLNLLRFSKLRVEDAMVPRSDITSPRGPNE